MNHETPSHQTPGDPCLSIEGFINHGIEISESPELDLVLNHDLDPSSKRSSLAWSESGGSRLGADDGNASNVDLSAILAGPGDSSSGIWDAESTHTEKSETGSLGPPYGGARSRSESSRSGGATKDVSHEGKGVRAMKKRKRNRHVDIDDIVIEFDPQKEYVWEMRLKYEREKNKKQKPHKSSSKSATSVQKSSSNSLSADKPLSQDACSLSEDKRINAEISSVTSHVIKEIKPQDVVEHDMPSKNPDANDQKGNSTSSEKFQGDSQNRIHGNPVQNPKSMSFSQKGLDANPIDESPNENLPVGNKVATPEHKVEDSNAEILVIHRLPGEKLGMGLRIESNGDDSDPVQGVFVQSITPGGAADKATGGTCGIRIGDEILKINGMPMKGTPYSESLTFFRALPLRMILHVGRVRVEDRSGAKMTSFSDDHTVGASQNVEIPEGFEVIDVSFEKEANESLGISIMPSYGSTRQYHQVSHLLVVFYY